MLAGMSWFSRLFRRPAAQPALKLEDLRAEWIIVGLGNPGDRYAATRHNVGFMALDDLLAAGGDVWLPVREVKADAALLTIADQAVLVVRPKTFMNLSGEAVAPLAQVPAERIIVIHDELDLPPHKVRLKQGGNENGHNGLKSLTEHLGTRDYLRVRVGIGRPEKGMSIPDFVLGPVDAGAGLDQAIARAAEGARLIVEKGLPGAQNVIHA